MIAPRRLAGAAALLAVLALAPHARAASPSAGVTRVDGTPCVSATDLARLVDGSLYWRADTRKLVLRIREHRVTLTVDVPLAIVDDRTLRLDAPVRSVNGVLQLPISLLPLLPRDSSDARLVVDPAGTRVRAVAVASASGAPRVTVSGDVTRVTITTARPADARVASTSRTHFRVRLAGIAPPGADSLPAGALVRALRRVPGEGVTWEMDLAPGTLGWRRVPAPEALVLEFAREGAGLEPFAPEGPAGPRPLRVVVLDPGHGGADAGVTATGATEKDLSLQLARALAEELERRSGARVLLTRDADRDLAQPVRAEFANRARADLVLSLHFDGAPLTRAHGATAWCAPAAPEDAARAARAGPLAMLPWRDVAVQHAVESRALADDVTAALDARGLGPARTREMLPAPLLGVNAPGLMLECATLTSAADLQRVTAPDGMRNLAAAIADGVIAWARHE